MLEGRHSDFRQQSIAKEEETDTLLMLVESTKLGNPTPLSPNADTLFRRAETATIGNCAAAALALQ